MRVSVDQLPEIWLAITLVNILIKKNNNFVMLIPF